MASNKPRTVALYLRVSTNGQTTENQRRELLQIAERHGWQVVQVFEDAGVSGSKGKDHRPGLSALMAGVSRKEFELVAAWSVDRLGRSLQHLVELCGELQAKKVGLYLHQQQLDTTTPAGRAMLGMVSVFAEFERAMIVERVNAGLARAKAQGKRLGRPWIGAAKEKAVREQLAKGTGILKTARLVGVGTGTVQRIKQHKC